ncbi:MAG: hypothetical protein IKE22_10020 [Atopobiaceae bacterium]|nr:hypothetical protein [Atopobiaceae bacterium]
MTTTTSWLEAKKEPFEAFGILYYPLFKSRTDLPTTLDDADLTWAMTANANLDGTGYTLSLDSVHVLAAYHHAMAELARTSTLVPLSRFADDGINPLADLQRLVPDVKANPFYPDFPTQVMEISEAQFRYDQAVHYLSTYGVESVAGFLGLDVVVGDGWRPNVEATPKTKADTTLVAPKVLHVLVTAEDLQAVVAARLARATRMHPAEIATTLLVFADLGADADAEQARFPKVAFHENMMELIRVAAQEDSAMLERVATGLAQHPGDLLKAVRYVLETDKVKHLKTRQKKGFCRAFEHFAVRSIARNIADARRHDRFAPNFLSIARFGGPNLREAVELVETGQVRSWTSELESFWNKVEMLRAPNKEKMLELFVAENKRHPVDVLREQFNTLYDKLFHSDEDLQTDAWRALLKHYGERPGVLLRSLSRLIKHECPLDLLVEEALSHAQYYSLPTLVRTLTLFSSANRTQLVQTSYAGFSVKDTKDPSELTPQETEQLCSVLKTLVTERMRNLETPLKDRRIHLNTSGISLVGSALMPNDTGNTGTAWPPAGIAFDLPCDKTIRFFTYWDDRKNRVDVDLHFVGRKTSGETLHVGWNSAYKDAGLLTSGDVTTSENSVEYLDATMDEAIAAEVDYVVQEIHIYHGARNWGDIQTCYSGALLVDSKLKETSLYNVQNLLFRDDLTGTGNRMAYAVINFPQHYVRILRDANMPLGNVGFSLGDYLEMLFEAQGTTVVDTPEEADLEVCVGRSKNPKVMSLFDEGFFLG